MSEAGVISLIAGLVLLAMSLAVVWRPEPTRRALLRFPRHTGSAWVLTALALIWVAVLLQHTPLGPFEPLKEVVWLLGPVAFYLLVVYLEELLAPRALGGLMLLAGVPILLAVRWHPSNLRWCVSVGVYVMVVAGMVLVLSPFRFRHAVEKATARDGRFQAMGLGVGAYGLLLIVLALAVFR